MIEAVVVLHYMVLYLTSDDQGAWVSSITSQTMELRIAIDVQVLYSHLHLFKKNRYETCE